MFKCLSDTAKTQSLKKFLCFHLHTLFREGPIQDVPIRLLKHQPYDHEETAKMSTSFITHLFPLSISSCEHTTLRAIWVLGGPEYLYYCVVMGSVLIINQ